MQRPSRSIQKQALVSNSFLLLPVRHLLLLAWHLLLAAGALLFFGCPAPVPEFGSRTTTESTHAPCVAVFRPAQILILTKPYVAGIFWVACAHLVPRVLLDYQGTSLTNETWQRDLFGELLRVEL